MRRLIKILGMSLVALFAMTPAAFAAESDPAAPLRVSQAIEASPRIEFPPTPQGVTAVHDVSVGDRVAPLRVRYGRNDLLDAHEAAARFGGEFNRHGDKLRFDRPASSERVEMSLTTGDVFVDGVLTGTVDTASVSGGDRMWLGTDILEALAGKKVDIAGRSSPKPEAPVSLAGDGSQQAHMALITPRMRAKPTHARLVLASYRESDQHAAPDAGREPLPQLRSFDRVFGQSDTQLAVPGGRSDWRGQASWSIEPEEPAAAPQAQPKLQMASIIIAPDKDKETSFSVVAPQQSVSKRKQAKSQQPEQRVGNPRLVLASAPAREADIRSAATLKSSAAEASIGTSKSLDAKAVIGGLNGYDASEASRPSSGNAELQQTRHAELRGAVFIDRNADGFTDSRDQLLEGERVQLIHQESGQILEQRSASFGRFSFVGLAPGAYRLRVMSGWEEYVVDVNLPPGQMVSRNAVIEMAIAARAPPDLAV